MRKHILLLGLALGTFAAMTSVHAVEGDAEAGKSKAASCAGCHGAEGQGMGPNPKIVGMSEEAFTKAMEAYKAGDRQHAAMQAMAAGLSEQDIADLAAYYSSL